MLRKKTEDIVHDITWNSWFGIKSPYPKSERLTRRINAGVYCSALEPTSTARPLRRLVVFGRGGHDGWPPCLPCRIPVDANIHGVLISMMLR
ncbi:hypothetical protein ZWY2020_005015 [Hordeum vulgare]|nr:hypothetical protein ZWY2020_005015 [Hordeum vulgare]